MEEDMQQKRENFEMFKSKLMENVEMEVKESEQETSKKEIFKSNLIRMTELELDHEIRRKFKEHAIYEKVNINELEDADHYAGMKLNNMKGGKQNHSCKNPCLYGECTQFGNIGNGVITILRWFIGSAEQWNNFLIQHKNFRLGPEC